MEKTEVTKATVIFHATISLILVAVGIYVLIEKKMIVGGKYSAGSLHTLSFPADIIMAASFFMLAAFFSLVLIQTEAIKKICIWLFMSSLVTFGISIFI